MDNFNIIQIILVFVVTFIAAIEQFSFLECMHQPIILCPVIGLILGQAELGIVVGGAYQLMSIGSMPVGGAQPPNVILGGVMATTFAISLGLPADASGVGQALGLAVPFAVFGQYAVTITFTLMSPLMSVADKYAEKADTAGITRINLLSMGILGTLFGAISVVGILVGTGLGDTLRTISLEYSWVMGGLDAAGGMMKFVGLAILMKIMLSSELWGFFFAGFAAAVIISQIESLSGAALIILAFIGVAIALYDYQTNVKIKQNAGSGFGGGMSDGI